MRTVFDLEVLRTFVVAVDLKGLSPAATILGRSTSAVSAHMKRLEDVIGAPVFRKLGRGVELTEAGAAMLVYARRMIDLDREAASSIKRLQVGGTCRIAVQQDFGDAILTDVLIGLAAAYPSVRIEVVIGGNSLLKTMVTSKAADVVIAWGTDSFDNVPYWSCQIPIRWIGLTGRSVEVDDSGTVPIVSLGEDCYFRSVALEALNASQRQWRIALSSPSLSGVWAGVKANLGVTARTVIGIPVPLKTMSRTANLYDLPELPDIKVLMFLPNGEEGVAESTASLFRDIIEMNVAQAGR